MNAQSIIISPIVSEKSMSDAAGGKYTFKVLRSSDKNAIRKAIEDRFKVNVVDISTITIKGRKHAVRTRTRNIEIIKTPFKKAVVKLAKDQKISIFDAGAKEGGK